MVDYVEIPVPADAELFTDKAYMVFDGMYPILTVGIQQYSMLTEQYYVWVKPEKYLRASHVRPLRRAMRIFEGATLFANIQSSDKRATRFAKLLGFSEKQQTRTVAYYERTE